MNKNDTDDQDFILSSSSATVDYAEKSNKPEIMDNQIIELSDTTSDEEATVMPYSDKNEMELMCQYFDFEYSIQNLKQETYIIMNLINVLAYLKQDVLKNDLLYIHNCPMIEYSKLIKDRNLKVNVDISTNRLSENYLTKVYLE